MYTAALLSQAQAASDAIECLPLDLHDTIAIFLRIETEQSKISLLAPAMHLELPSPLASVLDIPMDDSATDSTTHNESRLMRQLLEEQIKLLGSIDRRLGPPEDTKVVTREWDDDYGWAAILELALRKLGEEVKAWSDSLDTTLIFLGLFSAIVTAVLIPTSQNLSELPNQHNDQLLLNLTNILIQIASLNHFQVPDVVLLEAFKPAPSDEISAWFWYTSLVISILCAGLTVFTRIQMPDLPVVPDGLATKLVDKVRRLQLRDELCRQLILPTLDVVNWATVLAIIVFLSGLLFQLWNTHFQTPGRLLLSSAIIGTALSLFVAALIVILTLHATFSDESPFDTTLSNWIRYKVRGSELDPSHEPTPPVAAEHLTEIISGCDDVKSLERAAPVFVECLKFLVYGDQRLTPDLDPALIQILRHDTSPKVKMLVLRGIAQMVRSPRSDNDSAPETVLVRVLFQIQEEYSEQSPDVGLAAFRALIHISTPIQSDSLTSERPLSDDVARGLSNCGPHDLKVDARILPTFLGSVLAWKSLPENDQFSVLEGLPLASLVFSCVVTTFWAHKEVPSRNKRLEGLTNWFYFWDYFLEASEGHGIRSLISKLWTYARRKPREAPGDRAKRQMHEYIQRSAKEPRPLGRRPQYQSILTNIGSTIKIILKNALEPMALLQDFAPLLEATNDWVDVSDFESHEWRSTRRAAFVLLNLLEGLRIAIDRAKPENSLVDTSLLKWKSLTSILHRSIPQNPSRPPNSYTPSTPYRDPLIPSSVELKTMAYYLRWFSAGSSDQVDDVALAFLTRCAELGMDDVRSSGDDWQDAADFDSMSSEVESALKIIQIRSDKLAQSPETDPQVAESPRNDGGNPPPPPPSPPAAPPPPPPPPPSIASPNIAIVGEPDQLDVATSEEPNIVIYGPNVVVMGSRSRRVHDAVNPDPVASGSPQRMPVHDSALDRPHTPGSVV
ncbi:hypothetical protein SISNIDRAFT_467098 [Sistotremastrum niveocremeum HHB9708]|uniref:DUF6535 domain-containing protein n=1 Tax=Sistotremastrum niveocremeum HHB9708 TaxID=1314777 RepID=A0A164TCE7_9AGAM|nr:hypothetical protein SISNIDRAFT_467098 [Sistotremastrum niveocremeum HHB9708]